MSSGLWSKNAGERETITKMLLLQHHKEQQTRMICAGADHDELVSQVVIKDTSDEVNPLIRFGESNLSIGQKLLVNRVGPGPHLTS